MRPGEAIPLTGQPGKIGRIDTIHNLLALPGLANMWHYPATASGGWVDWPYSTSSWSALKGFVGFHALSQRISGLPDLDTIYTLACSIGLPAAQGYPSTAFDPRLAQFWPGGPCLAHILALLKDEARKHEIACGGRAVHKRKAKPFIATPPAKLSARKPWLTRPLLRRLNEFAASATYAQAGPHAAGLLENLAAAGDDLKSAQGVLNESLRRLAAAA